MKQVIIFRFILSCSLGLNAQNSFAPIKKNVFKASVLSPIFNALNLSYQRILSPQRSLQIGFSSMDFNDDTKPQRDYNNFYYEDYTEKNNIKGLNVIAEYRLNVSGYGINGYYFGPFVRYMNYSRTRDYNSTKYIFSEKSEYQSMGLGFIVGKQFIIKNLITVDVFGGPVYQALFSSSRVANVSYTASGNNAGEASLFLPDELLSKNILNNYISGYGVRAGVNVGIAF